MNILRIIYQKIIVMATNKNHIEKISINNLDEWLGSTGFLYPTNELELARFNKLYANYDFKLKNSSIDVQSILKNNVCPNVKSLIFIKDENIESEIQELRMAARKGSQNISQQIIDKMRKHHTEDDSE
jgi:hypothetical protein